jgi:hypothetical protein
MRFAPAIVALVTSSGLLAAGCAHELVPQPPLPGDVLRINEAAADNDWFRVEYVEPLAAAEGVRVERPIAIAGVDERRISLRTRAGDVQTIPLELVRGVTVKERAPAVKVGALAGLAWGVLVIGGLWLLGHLGPEDPGAPPPRCDGGCQAKMFVPLLGVPTLIGGVVGYFVGGRRTFDFVPPTPLPPPL